MSATATTLNVSDLIDKNKLSGLQMLTLVLCALVTFIDGMDTQSIGIVSQPLAEHLNFNVAKFGYVFSAALLGAGLGALTFGQLGDRYGRKLILVAAAVIFGAFTILTAWTTTYEELLACRFIAGLGLGGAMPNVVALNSEYAPKRIRAVMVLLQWSSFPFGGVLGGIAARYLLKHQYPWQSVFYFGGGIAFVVALLLLLLLPESLKYLIAKGGKPQRIRSIVEKLARGTANAATTFTITEERVERANLGSLFREKRALTTLCLWMTFAVAFAILVFTPLWAGALLGGKGGIAPEDIALIVIVNNIGSTIGGIIAGLLMDRFNSYRILTPAFLLGTIFTVLIGHAAGSSFNALLTITTLSGFFMGVGGNGAVALAAQSYPTGLRATGMGWSVSMARFGQVASSLLTGWMISQGMTVTAIFTATGLAALVAAAAMIVLWLRNPPRY